MDAVAGHNANARRELAALLDEALRQADTLGETLVAARISQALDGLRRA